MYAVFVREWVSTPDGLPIENFDCVPDSKLEDAVQEWKLANPMPESQGISGGFMVPGNPPERVELGVNGLDCVRDQRTAVLCESKRDAEMTRTHLQRLLTRKGQDYVRVGFIGIEDLEEIEQIEAKEQANSGDDTCYLGQYSHQAVRASISPQSSAVADQEIPESKGTSQNPTELTVTPTPAGPPPTKRQQTLLKLLETAGLPITQVALAKDIGFSRSTVEKDVRSLKLRSTPLVKTSHKGVELTVEGQQRLNPPTSSPF